MAATQLHRTTASTATVSFRSNALDAKLTLFLKVLLFSLSRSIYFSCSFLPLAGDYCCTFHGFWHFHCRPSSVLLGRHSRRAVSSTPLPRFPQLFESCLILFV